MQREAAFGSRGDRSSSRWSSEGGSWHGLPGSALPSGLVQGPDWGTQPHFQVRVVQGTTAIPLWSRSRDRFEERSEFCALGILKENL